MWRSKISPCFMSMLIYSRGINGVDCRRKYDVVVSLAARDAVRIQHGS